MAPSPLLALLCTLSVALLATSVSGVKLTFGTNTAVASGIYDAENQLVVQPSGRILVSGGDNVYEIVPASSSNTTFDKVPIITGEVSYFLGMVQVDSVIYLLRSFPGCVENQTELVNSIYAAPVPAYGAPFVFRSIFNISNFVLPNGLAYHNSRLYVADTAYTHTTGQIGMFAISPSDPFTILSQQTFVDHAHATQPNGVKILNGVLYFTTLGTLKRVPINDDGTAGTVQIIFEHATVLDDMNFLTLPGYNNTILMVCNYLGGSIYFWDIALGQLLAETTLEGIAGPSSLLQNTLPYFPTNAVLLTDKGAVCFKGEPGNYYSYFTVSVSN